MKIIWYIHKFMEKELNCTNDQQLILLIHQFYAQNYWHPASNNAVYLCNIDMVRNMLSVYVYMF